MKNILVIGVIAVIAVYVWDYLKSSLFAPKVSA